MNGSERRLEILKILENNDEPISGIALSEKLNVSRQIIVNDIALIRANGHEIFSTNRGYVMQKQTIKKRIMKVIHTDDEVRKELECIVDMGGRVKDVFIFHKVYGTLKADMNISSRLDIEKFMDDIKKGKSGLLMNVTSGYHYHTITAKSDEILDMIEQKLDKMGFMAEIKEYEPEEIKKSSVL